MNAARLPARAQRSPASAKLLFDAGDPDGCCNRAYYAMFDAARATLASQDEEALAGVRSHSGLISIFGDRLVKTGRVSVEHGRALNKVEELRRIADYRGETPDAAMVHQAMDQAEAFVVAMLDLCGLQR